MENNELIKYIVGKYEENKNGSVVASDLGISIPRNAEGKKKTRFLIKIKGVCYYLSFNELADLSDGVRDALANKIKSWVG